MNWGRKMTSLSSTEVASKRLKEKHEGSTNLNLLAIAEPKSREVAKQDHTEKKASTLQVLTLHETGFNQKLSMF